MMLVEHIHTTIGVISSVKVGRKMEVRIWRRFGTGSEYGQDDGKWRPGPSTLYDSSVQGLIKNVISVQMYIPCRIGL